MLSCKITMQLLIRHKLLCILISTVAYFDKNAKSIDLMLKMDILQQIVFLIFLELMRRQLKQKIIVICKDKTHLKPNKAPFQHTE